MPNRLLFLCTANYYRSRFAEILFNHMAPRRSLDWVAFSRAVAIEQGAGNLGPISRHARSACGSRGIPLPHPLPGPQGVRPEDFAAAAHIIALKEAEHRPYIEGRYADWADRIEYWHVDDLDGATAEVACSQIERHVLELIDHLAGAPVR